MHNDTSQLYLLVPTDRIFRSQNRGASWTECNGVGQEVIAIAASPHGDVLYLATDTDVLKSTDCHNWTPTNLGQEAGKLVVLSDDSVLAAGHGLWHLSGGIWTTIPSPVNGDWINALRLDPTEKQILLATQNNGVVHSADSGATWKLINNGLGLLKVHDIAFDPNDSQRLYAAVEGGLYRSTNAGESWGKIYFSSSYAVAVDSRSTVAVTAVSGLFTSTDGGDNFSFIDRRSSTMNMARAYELVFDPEVAGRLYAVTGRGLFVTPDQSWQWSEINSGINAWDIRAIVVMGPSTLLAATLSGVLRSVDSGNQWSLRSKGFPYISTTHSLALDPTKTDMVYSCGEQLLRSHDQGLTYSDNLYQTQKNDAWHASVVHIEENRIYLGTRTRLVVSTDSGANWVPRNIAGAQRRVEDLLYVDTIDPGLIVATSSGVFYTTDDGVSFVPYSQGLGNLNTLALAFAPDGSVAAGTADGVYFSATIGGPWSASGLAGHRIRDLLYFGNTMTAACDHGVFFRVGSGPWQLLPGLQNKWPRSLAVDQQGRLLVGTDGHGLYRALGP